MPRQINRNQIAAQEAWNVPQYSPAWSDYDTTEFYGGRFMKDTLGFVQMKGLVKNVSGSTQSASQIFLLPIGYRPIHKIRMITPAGGTGSGHCWIDVFPTGVVQLNGYSVPSNEWVSLSSIRYLADGA